MATDDDIEQLTDANFEARLGAGDRPTLVAFYAPWSSVWRRVSSGLKELADAVDASHLRLCRLDVDTHPQTASNYGVRSLPTFLLFENGRAIGRIRGGAPPDRLEAFVVEHLSSE